MLTQHGNKILLEFDEGIISLSPLNDNWMLVTDTSIL